MTESTSEHLDSVKFAPGTAVAIVGPNVAGLIADDPRSELVRRVWSAARSGAVLDDLLDLMASVGLRSLPSIGLVELDGEDVRVVVRGEVAALFEPLHTGRVVKVLGDRVHSWVEHVESGVGGVHLHLADDLSDIGAFETTGGLFPASRLALVFSEAEPEAVGPLTTDWVRPTAVAPVVEGLAEWGSNDGPGPVLPPPAPSFIPSRIAAPHELGDLLDPGPPAGPGTLDDLGDSSDLDSGDPLADEPVADERATDEPVIDDVGRPDVANDTLAVPLEDLDLEPEEDAEERPVGASLDAESVDGAEEESAEEGSEDEYDRLFGATQFRTVEDAAVRATDEPKEHADELAPDVPPLIESAPPGEIPAPSDAGDHDGMTITLAELQAMARRGPEVSAPPVASTPGAPMVQAVSCANGHLNPPHAGDCRICRRELAPQPQVTVARPVLGTLRFADGSTVELSRPLILGRSPKVDGAVGDEIPELVALASPKKEMSGTHLELRLDGWTILAVDRQSTNGTVITMPGRDPQRLHPGEPFPITIGTSVNLADEAVFVLEAAQ